MPECRFLTVYVVREELDKTEGRLGTKVIGCFSDRHVAKEVAVGRGVMGTLGHVEQINAIEVEGDFFSIHPIEVMKSGNDLIRANALQKLSPQERQVLGL